MRQTGMEKMVRRLLFLLGALLMVSADAWSLDLVIESRSQGKNNSRYKEMEGTWADSQNPPYRAKSSAPGLTDQTACGSRKFLFAGEASAQMPPAAARFMPQFASPGHYYVYVTWPSGASATPVTYTVKHAKGESKVTLTQDGWGDLSGGSNANSWISLGDFDFNAGDAQYVEVRVDPGVSAVGSHYGQVYADACRFSTEAIDGAAAASGPVAGSPVHVVQTPYPSRSDPAPATGYSSPASYPSPSFSSPAAASGPSIQAALFDLKWYEDVQEGFKAAQQAGKNIMIFFYTPESASSRAYDQLFQNGSIKSVLVQKYVVIKVNFLQNTDLGYKLGAFKGGTINIYNSSGTGLDQITDELTAAELETKLRAY